jgi:hypothetical protein
MDDNDYNYTVKRYTALFNSEEQAADYAWLLFLYDREIIRNILFHMKTQKDKPIRIPDRYQVVYHDVCQYFNRYYGGKKDGQTKK